jgi:hypothetical protein
MIVCHVYRFGNGIVIVKYLLQYHPSPPGKGYGHVDGSSVFCIASIKQSIIVHLVSVAGTMWLQDDG